VGKSRIAPRVFLLLLLGPSCVIPEMSPEDCRHKARECLLKAEQTTDPSQRAAMLTYARWWTVLADYPLSAAAAKKPEQGQ